MTEQFANPEEKIRQYRRAARRAEKSASEATEPDIRQAYLQITRTWIYLAEELEREVALADQDHSEGEQADDIFVPRSVDRFTHKSH